VCVIVPVCAPSAVVSSTAVTVTVCAAFQFAVVNVSVAGDTVIVSKGMDPEEDAYSCFQASDSSGRPFSAALGARGIQRIYVGGLATDYCVKATALDAVREGFEVVILADAIRAVNLTPGDGDRAIAEMRDAGAGFVTLLEL